MEEIIHDPFLEVLKRAGLYEQVAYNHPLIQCYQRMQGGAQMLEASALSREQRILVCKLIDAIALVVKSRFDIAKRYTQAIRRSFSKRPRSKVSERKCHYCGGPDESMDHLIPASRGGRNNPENTVPACVTCNAMKADMTVDEFRDQVHLIFRHFVSREGGP